MRRNAILIIALVVAVGAIFLARGLLRPKKQGLPAVTFASVERRDLTVTVEATGTVEPINLVEIKSKASGQILRMPVEVGSVVRPGDLLAQIDSVDVRNQYDQAYAALQAAKAKAEVSAAQRVRTDTLFAQQIVTAVEHESALLDFANAESQLVTARTNLDIARQRLADATVRAPVAGTVVAKPVSVGQVISSATSSVSGGTTLLQMADLLRVRIRALVSESDIGSVRSGQTATVRIDAYPTRPFEGQVEKIEPQSVVQQSVTMFPVLVSISNQEGLLLPGMNGEVTLLVQERTNVVSVPLDAVRTVRELASVATALGMDVDSVRAQIQAMRQAENGGGTRVEGRAARGRAPGDSVGGRRRWAGGNRSGGAGAGRTGAGTGGMAADASQAGRGGQTQIVFAKVAGGLAPRIVKLGLNNFDYAEILDGVKEGDQVALLSVAELQAQRTQNVNRIRQRMGSSMPGVGGAGRTGGGATRRGGS